MATVTAAANYCTRPKMANLSAKDEYKMAMGRNKSDQNFDNQNGRARREFLESTQIDCDDRVIGISKPSNSTDANAKLSKDRRRKNASKTSSGYGSNSTGESDNADGNETDPFSQHPQRAHFGLRIKDATSRRLFFLSPDMAGSPEKMSPTVTNFAKKTLNENASSPSASSSSSANSLMFSSTGYSHELRSTFTDEILKVLEEGGLIAQTPDDLSPQTASRRSSVDCNVIELSRKYRKKELSQKRAVDKVQQVADIRRLQQMLNATEDEFQIRAIRERLTMLKYGDARAANQHRSRSIGGRLQNFADNQHYEKHLSTRDHQCRKEKNSPDSANMGGIASLTLPSPVSSNGTVQTKNSSSTQGATKITAQSASEIKSALLRWCQMKTKGYPHVFITNYSKSWCDGMAFCALIHHFCPDAFEYSTLDPRSRRANFELAFRVAEEYAGIVPLLDVDDMISMGDYPEYKCVFTYIVSIYKRFHSAP